MAENFPCNRPLIKNNIDLLKGCIKNTCVEGIIKPIDATVLAPYVKVTISDASKDSITVGNNSDPLNINKSAIKSLKYSTAGVNGGLVLEVEIVDADGGAFSRFIRRIMRQPDFKLIKTNNWITAEWGWIGIDCAGIKKIFDSTKHTLFLKYIEFTYQHGVIKYTLKCQDISVTAFDTTVDGVKGKEIGGQKMPLKQAIRALCEHYETEVLFIKAGKSRNDSKDKDEWDFEEKADNGGPWFENGQNFIATIWSWIRGYKTKNGLGVTLNFNSKDIKPGGKSQMILWEYTIDCKETSNNLSIGTYIVNGGNGISPVISFSPQIKWQWGYFGESGGSVGVIDMNTQKERGDPDCLFARKEPPNPGTPIDNITSDNVRKSHNKDADRKVKEAQYKHERANIIYHPIRAELKIQGDPDLADPFKCIGKTLSLIVINPFHIINKTANENKDIAFGQEGKKLVCDWLINDVCNDVLTSKNWILNGAYHEIRDGNYTTTLKIFLPAPSSELKDDAPLGGINDAIRFVNKLGILAP